MSLLVLDQNITESLSGLTRDNSNLQKIIYVVATYPIFLVPITLLWLFCQKTSRHLAVKTFILTIFTWQVISKSVGEFFYTNYGFRDRPLAFSGLQEFLFEQPQKSFPSDHAAVLILVTLALFYYRQKKLAWVFLAATLLSSLARVMIGFHFVGDILGGMLIGLVGFGLLVALDQPLQKLLEKLSGLIGQKNESKNV